MLIGRFCAIQTGVVVPLAASVATATVIRYEHAAGGVIILPAGATTVLLTWYVAEAVDGTFVPAVDGEGNAITTVVTASQGAPIPAELFGAAALKVIGDVATTAIVSLKG
jgi:hypothetical protein